MKKPLIAALLSALLIPGAGHLYLKSRLRGATLIAIVLGSITAIVIQAGKMAVSVLGTIEAEGGMVTNQRVIELATQSIQQTSSTAVTTATFLIIACWLFGIFDSYHLAKQSTANA